MRLFLTFGTTHGALRAERVLTRAGITARVVPKPAAIRGACGLAVCLDADVEDRALQALAAARHPPRQRAVVP